MTTATLFNCSYGPTTGRNPHPAPVPVRSIVIVGGGTAGWMTALILARSLSESGVQITLLESPTVGIIVLAEGPTPGLHETQSGLCAQAVVAGVSPSQADNVAAGFLVVGDGSKDLFIDKALRTPYVSFAGTLSNAAAISIPSRIWAPIPSETLSSALS